MNLFPQIFRVMASIKDSSDKEQRNDGPQEVQYNVDTPKMEKH